jgi:hypothetical protein
MATRLLPLFTHVLQPTRSFIDAPWGATQQSGAQDPSEGGLR